MPRDAVMEVFWIFQDCEYDRFLHMYALTVIVMTGLWICLVKVSQGFKYASGSKYDRARNMEGCEYGRVIKDAEYAWIRLNIP